MKARLDRIIDRIFGNRYAKAVAYVLVVVIGVAGFWRVETTVNRLDTVVNEHEAERCVNSWEARAQIREAITIPGEALIETFPNAEPDVVALFRANTDRRVREAYPDPDCDLEAAKAELNQ